MYRKKRIIIKLNGVISDKKNASIEFYLDPCARVNCNYGRCEIDRSRPTCRCYQGYTGHECVTPIGEWNMLVRGLLSFPS